MSGHSRWSTIKRKKAAADAKKGQIFTKIIREIIVAAKAGGGDPDSNSRLRTVIEKAKAANMPLENIKKAIQKGTGELPGVSYEEITYEGYGPGGVALLIKVTTDNKNRSAADIRTILSKNGGSMAAVGSTSWQFEQKGYISVPKEEINEEALMEIVLDAGAQDIQTTENSYDVMIEPANFEKVKRALDDKKVKYTVAEITMIPKSYVKLEGKDAEQMLKLMNALDENDDVQNVYANFDIPQEIMDKLSENI